MKKRMTHTDANVFFKGSDSKKRYPMIDTIRGTALISMILYHACYDLVVMYGVDLPWFYGQAAYYWQQITAMLFILIAGISYHFTKRPLNNAIKLILLGLVISIITKIFIEEQFINFGVISFMGMATLITIPFRRILLNLNSKIITFIFIFLFLVTKNIADGVIGIDPYFYTIPKEFFIGEKLAWLGFPGPGFSSSDYFPLIPWLFCFLTGVSLWNTLKDSSVFVESEFKGVPFINYLGRHSLWVYVLHQPITIACMIFFFTLLR